MDAVLHKPGVTLESLADAKRLPLEFLKSRGFKTSAYGGSDAVEMVFTNPTEEATCTRYRVALGGARRTLTKKGDKTFLIAAEDVVERAAETGRIWLVEGETDWLTLTYHGEVVVAAMGGSNINAERDGALLARLQESGADMIAVLEPDRTGWTFVEKLAAIIGDCLKVASFDPEKDPSALHIALIQDKDAYKNSRC